MIGGRTEIDIEAVADLPPRFARISSGLDDVLGRIVEMLDAESGCWGADDIGADFARAYLPPVDEVRTAMGAVRDRVGEVSQSMRLCAAAADTAERRANERFGG